MSLRTKMVLYGFCTFFSIAAINAAPMKQDDVHVRTWNNFAQNVLQLHRQLTRGKEVTIKLNSGGYAQMPAFYDEHAYYLNGRLVSRVQWEREQPDALHSIEVFIHDDSGRVVRDFVAAYLPHYRNAPSQTLISLHHYNDSVHAFRSFDASGARIIERCQGSMNGEQVNLLLDEDDIYAAQAGDSQVMQSAEYQHCFAGLQTEAGRYLTPQ